MTVVLNDPATLADLGIRAERLTELPAKQIVHWWPQ